ncbi:MAG TPA: sigma-70 family RNA polymerase sigma factor [Steroidobacteraceae bacterium]|jgi:RNA polymerase sigma factor (sigma-70 family)|nr:sigma-70 family RNA polymerase sigma factor [Steroidobacteraceae bacterium]
MLDRVADRTKGKCKSSDTARVANGAALSESPPLWYAFSTVDDLAQPAVLNDSKPALVRRDSGIDVLYARHWSELCHYIKKHFGAGPPDPEDVVQETFIKYAAIEDRETIDNPRAYLFRTAHNVLVDERRKLAVRRAMPGDGAAAPMSDDRTPERVLVGQERLQVLRRTLRAMPEARRRSFLLNRLQGLSAAAIARKTGYSESAVKKHISLALADLEAAVTDAESIALSDLA